MEEVAKNYGDDRRTSLQAEGEITTESSATKKLVNAELTDSPSAITLTAAGRVFRSEDAKEPAMRKNGYRNWFASTTRSDVVFVTDAGRMLRTHVGDIPVGDYGVHNSGTPAAEFLGLGKKEKVLAVFPVDEKTVIALGTKDGTVKRITPDYPAKADFSCINLKGSDKVVGAAASSETDEVVFITQDAQFLRFDAKAVRPQGVNGAGMAGIKTESEVVYFGVLKPKEKNIVLTVANSSASLPGTDGGGIKISKLAEFPKKGRATGGVRCQKFIRGQNQIVLGYVGPEGFQLVDGKGKAIGVEYELQKRDASGDPAPAISYVGRT
jgi:DNA gyrase subunit A